MVTSLQSTIIISQLRSLIIFLKGNDIIYSLTSNIKRGFFTEAVLNVSRCIGILIDLGMTPFNPINLKI